MMVTKDNGNFDKTVTLSHPTRSIKELCRPRKIPRGVLFLLFCATRIQ